MFVYSILYVTCNFANELIKYANCMQANEYTIYSLVIIVKFYIIDGE